MSLEISIGLTTCKEEDDALHLINTLLERGLIACGQLEGPILSKYTWNKEIRKETEWRILLKFKTGNQHKILNVLNVEHKYDVPQWVYWEAKCSQEFSRWVNDPPKV